MARKPRIAIIGLGNLGTALALSLHRAGYAIEIVVGTSLTKARRLGKQVGAKSSTSFSASDLASGSIDLLWFCVPDSQIALAARSVANKISRKGIIAFHSSGALTSSALDALRAKGAGVASVHPLMSFVRGSQPSLHEVPFAIEGDRAAVRIARRIVRDLGGQAYSIRKQDKASYHTWSTFTSPLLTALLATTEHVAGLAGIKSKAAKQRMTPILLQTLANYFSRDAAVAFSGPIIRGDADTIRQHLRVLRRAPAARRVYAALALAALEYLPAKNKLALKRLLDPSRT
jgi:predicted short-subunit dehydrogenase-like oxidoreductase (DUF2520 family)